jgi:hypothetical protein
LDSRFFYGRFTSVTMAIYWRPLTPERLALCTPLWSDRSAYTPSEFRDVVARLRLLLSERRALGAVIFEDERVRGFGVTVFAKCAAVDTLLAAPYPQFGKRLLLEEAGWPGQSDVLDRQQIGEGNATTGLQLVVVNTNFDGGARNTDAVIGMIIESFQAVHRGYRIARIVNEISGEAAIAVAVTSRSFELRARFDNVGGVKGLPSALFTLTSQQAAAWVTPLLPMFVYSPPRIAFTEAEQSILLVALTGEPDAGIARRLQMPLTAVKSRWSRLQERALAAVPDEFREIASRRTQAGRGPQNRHRILEYVRHNPSELTPYTRSVVRGTDSITNGAIKGSCSKPTTRARP